MPPRRTLILVNPVNPARVGLTTNKSSRFPPLALGILAALTPASWKVELIDENWETFQYRDGDLVGITAFTATVNRAYQIAAQYRQRGVPVVAGGIHVSARPDEALRYVDAVVVGEAESVWAQVLSDAEKGELKSRYQGGLTCPWPHPRRDLFHPGYLFASLQTSRGCPMDCEFCSVTAFNGRRYRRRPVDEVLDELASIPQKMLFFVDDNIIGYGEPSRQEALSLFRAMVECKMKKQWFCQASLNFADEEVLHWAARAGCQMVFLGLEATEAEALQDVNKALNLKSGAAGYRQAFRRIHRAGIAVLGAFIYGMDSDTPEAIRRRADDIARCGVDVFQTTVLTPLPGTRLFDRLEGEGRLLYTNFPADWDRYDMTEVLYQPARMSAASLTRAVRQADARLLGSRTLIASQFLKTLVATRRVTAGLWALSSNLNYRAVGRTSAKTARQRL